MFRKKLTLGASALAALALVATACGDGGEEETGDETFEVNVTQAFQSLYYLSLYVADQEGFFEEHGIEIQGSFGNAGSGGAALASVLQGETDIALGGPENVAFTNEQGGDTVAFASAANSAPNWMVAQEGVELDDPADLEGMSVAVGPPPVTSNTLFQELLQANDLTYNVDVAVNEVQQGSEVAPAISGDNDFAVAGEPLVSQAIQEGLHIVYDWTEQYPEFAYSTFMTTREVVESEPDMIQAFTAAINDALNFIQENPEGAVAVAIDEFPELDEQVVEDAVNRMIESGVYRENALITEEAIETALERQTFVGNLDDMPDYLDTIDPSFAEEVIGE